MSAILKTNLTTISAYNEAQTTIAHWGVGGDYSRALNVVTNIIVGSTAGQGTTQLSGNAIAPYAAELIGNTFDHTDNPNEVAQLLSHAVLGGVLAYVNGGNATSGAIAGAGAEAASLAITQELYPEAFDENGVFHRDQLTETQANAILALSSAVGAFVGGVSGGGINNVVIDANVAGNAVENNAMSTDPRLNVFYGTKTGVSPEEKAGFIQGVKNVNTFSTVGAITSALDETTLIFTPFLSAAGLLTEWMLWKMGDTNFAEVSRGQMIDQLPGESPKVKVIKEVAKEVTKQVLPVDKN